MLSHGLYQIRDINWTAGFDIHPFNPYVTHGLCLVPMSCREWRLVWSVNFALHAELAKVWRHNDLIYAQRLTMTLVPTASHCSKRDVTMVSGSMTTLNTVRSQRQQRAMQVRFFDTDILKHYCHFIDRAYESPHMMHIEHICLGIWYELFQDIVRLFIKGCDGEEKLSLTFLMDSTWHCPWLKVG